MISDRKTLSSKRHNKFLTSLHINELYIIHSEMLKKEMEAFGNWKRQKYCMPYQEEENGMIDL
jgi:hypothetical protein